MFTLAQASTSGCQKYQCLGSDDALKGFAEPAGQRLLFGDEVAFTVLFDAGFDAAEAATVLQMASSTANAFRGGFERDRPNILWVSFEDTNPFYGCYGDTVARTPTVDRLAAEGTRYPLAFSTAGCAHRRVRQ